MPKNLYILIKAESYSKAENYGKFNNFENFINNLLPVPNEPSKLAGSIAIPKDFMIYSTIPNNDPNGNKYILDDFSNEMKKAFESSISLDIHSDLSSILKKLEIPESYCDLLECRLKEIPECYSIVINDKLIVMQSREEHGMFYACQTLLQILNQCKADEEKFTIPCMNILDRPNMQIRGIADDITRGQVPTVESAKRYIYHMSRFKLNTYYIGYEQDFFHFKDKPIVHKEKAALSAEDVKEIEEYAKKRFVDVAPIYTVFGHQDNILQLPEYRDLGEFPGSQCFNIADERMYDVMESHIKELTETFSSETFHMGCDESFDLGSLKSAKYLKETGKGPALLKHYTRMYEILKKYGKKRIIMYHDIIAHYDESLKKAPKDLNIMYWEYSPKKEYKPLIKLVNSGLPIIVSPSHLNWCRHFPDFINASQNIISLIEYAKLLNKSKNSEFPGIVGQMNSTWGDFNNHNLRENNIYDSILSGASSWTDSPITTEKFLESFIFHFFGITDGSNIKKMSSLIINNADLVRYYQKGFVYAPLMFFMQLYKHPFAFEKPKLFIKNYHELIEKCGQLLKILENVKSSVKNNEKFLEYIKYSLDIALLFGKKMNMMKIVSSNAQKLLKINKNSENSAKKSSEKQKLEQESIEIISDFITDAERIALDYENLWLYCAKRQILDHPLGRFKNMIRYCREKIEQIKNGIYYQNPFLKSAWIAPPGTPLPPNGAFFRKSFNLEEIPKVAKMLVMAGDYCKVYLNGSLLGEVLSRMSLSYVPIQERVQLFDVTDRLQKGRNLIAIESYCYEKIRTKINVMLRMEVPKSTESELHQLKDIPSDNSWFVFNGYHLDNPDLEYISASKSSTVIELDWNSNVSEDYEMEHSNWKQSKILGYPPEVNLHIYDEDLLNGVVPYTEEYYDFKGFTYNMFRTIISPLVAKILMPFLGIAKKILKIN